MRSPAIARALVLVGSLATCALLASTEAGATPPPAKPPSAYTGYAPALTASSATVRVKVNPHGLATEYVVQYGPTAAYGAQTPSASAGSGTQESLLTQTIAGLAPFTTYHYRVVATSAAGTTEGRDAAFTTKKLPLSLTLAATPDQAVFGSPLTVSGMLSGTGNSGVAVVLQGNPFPYTHGFHNLTSTEPTSATGAFSFPIAGLLQSTELRASTVGKPVIHSPVITETVAIRVTLHVRPAHRRGFVRLYGTVTPSEPGALVAFEWKNRENRYVTVSGTTIRAGTSGLSRFERTVRLHRRGLYRALVQIASGAQVSGRSRPVRIR